MNDGKQVPQCTCPKHPNGEPLYTSTGKCVDARCPEHGAKRSTVEAKSSNPLASMGSNVFVRRYKDERGIWHEERQVNLGGEQGTVTYVHLNDYNDAKAEIERLRAALERIANPENPLAPWRVMEIAREALRVGVEHVSALPC